MINSEDNTRPTDEEVAVELETIKTDEEFADYMLATSTEQSNS